MIELQLPLATFARWAAHRQGVGSNRITFGEPDDETRTPGFAVEIGPRRRELLGPSRLWRVDAALRAGTKMGTLEHRGFR